MQAVAKAKDKIKKFRRRPSSSCHERRGSVEDLPPPYSENPPFNPFYNDLVHSVSQSGGGPGPGGDLDTSQPELELSGRSHEHFLSELLKFSEDFSIGASCW